MALEEVGAKFVTQGQEAFMSAMKSAMTQSVAFGNALYDLAKETAKAIPEAFEKVIGTTIEWGQSLKEMGDRMGTTTEQSAGLAVMAKTLGINTEQLTGAFGKFGKGLETAKGQLGPVGLELKNLGVNVYDAQGNLQDMPTILGLVADKFSDMPDGIEKTAAMMSLFGRSGADLDEILAASAHGGMADYIKEAKEMGLAIDPAKSFESAKAFETQKLVFTGLTVQLGSALLPAIQTIVKWFTQLAQSGQVKKFFQDFLNIVNSVVDSIITNWPAISATFQNVFNTISSPVTGTVVLC